MADTPEVHIGENSKEEVAYKLMERIAYCEGKVLHGMGTARPDRKWVLDTYAECLQATYGHRSFPNQ